MAKTYSSMGGRITSSGEAGTAGSIQAPLRDRTDAGERIQRSTQPQNGTFPMSANVQVQPTGGKG